MTREDGVVDGGDDPLLRVACSSCGYRLRGLDPAGQCPECGQFIFISLRHSLVQAPISWLETVSEGLRYLGYGALAIVAVIVVLAVMLLIDSVTSVGNNSAVVLGFVSFLAISVISAAVVLWMGTKRITDEPPAMVTIGSPSLRGNIRRAFGWAIFGSIICGPIGWICWPWYYYQLGGYTGELAKQAGVPKLGKSMEWACYLAAAGHVLSTLVQFVPAMLPANVARWAVSPSFILMPIAMTWLGICALKLQETLTRVFIYAKRPEEVFE